MNPNKYRRPVWFLLGCLCCLFFAQVDCAGEAQTELSIEAGAKKEQRPELPESIKDPQKPLHRPWNMAHRGGAKLYPENTLVAFEYALREHKVDVLELDVHQTQDGVIVVQHDETMESTTDCKGSVRKLSFAAYQKCNAAAKFSPPSDVSNRFEGKFIPHPSLEQVFIQFPNQRFAIEIKQLTPLMGKAMVALIEKHKKTDTAFVVSLGFETMLEVRKTNKLPKTGLSGQEIAEFVKAVNEDVIDAYQPPGTFVQIPFALVTARLVRAAHQKGLEVHPWTVNDKEQMETLLKLGVDGIITDRPDRMAEVLKKLGF